MDEFKTVVVIGWVVMYAAGASLLGVLALSYSHVNIGRVEFHMGMRTFEGLVYLIMGPAGAVAVAGHFITIANTGEWLPGDYRDSAIFVDFCWFLILVAAPLSALWGVGILARSAWQRRHGGQEFTGSAREPAPDLTEGGTVQARPDGEAIEFQLQPGERMIWSGSPKPAVWAFVRLMPLSILVPCVVLLLAIEADFSGSLPRHPEDLVAALVVAVAWIAIHRRVSRGSKRCRYIVTDSRVAIVDPIVLVPPWIRRRRVEVADLTAVAEPSFQALPWAGGYGNVYFGTPSGWGRRPSAFPFAYLPVERLEFFAIPDAAGVTQRIRGLRQGLIVGGHDDGSTGSSGTP